MKDNFICATEEYCKLYKYVSAPYIRKDFFIGYFEKAKLSICGLGFYELFLNGKKITKGKFAPYISNPEHLIYYDEYDITHLLKQGGNAIGVILGNGFLNNIGGYPWEFDKATFRSSPKLSLILEIDGKEILRTDESFKTAPSPIYFDDLRCGEYYDAQREQEGWATYGFDDSSWAFTKKTNAPKGDLIKASVEPITIRQKIQPCAITLTDGGFIVDFGVNTAGACRLKIKGTKGQKIVLWHGEVLTKEGVLYINNTCTPSFDRNMTQKDIFICSGNEDVFEPSFTYHGFRYVFIEGLKPECINDFSITMLQLSSDLKTAGCFTCSNQTVNSLQEITLNSDVSNFFYFPTDCPQREKNGWTADAALSCEQLLCNFDCSNSLKEWLKNIRYAQKENGQLPGVVPTVEFGYNWGNGPAWDIALIELPYQIFRFTGDKGVLEENVQAIAKYIAYLKTKVNDNGLIAVGLPDWCECGKLTEGRTSTPLEVTDSLVAIEICHKAEKIFNVLGCNECAEQAVSLEKQLKEKFRAVWLDENLFVKCKSQTAQAKAIDVGVFTDAEKENAFLNLLEIIKNNNGYFQVGVIGSRVLFRVLAENGYANLALEMITKEGFPSYKYWLNHGATSLWEGFNELKENSIFRKDGWRMLSLNHHFWGDISAWFYRYVLGININPDFKEEIVFEIAPVYLNGIDNACGSYMRNGKGIRVARRQENNIIYLKIETFGGAIYKIIPIDNLVIE